VIVGNRGLSLYVMGLASGPMTLAPLSEVRREDAAERIGAD
jgi:hypothetical protein